MKLTKQVWLVSSVALAACGGGSSTADAPIAAIDAPPGGSIDAPIGSPDGAHTIDAATSPDAAVPGPVTVNAFTPKGLPASGLPIAFLNADGSVVLETTTDRNGVATATMLAGGSVTLGAAIR